MNYLPRYRIVLRAQRPSAPIRTCHSERPLSKGLAPVLVVGTGLALVAVVAIAARVILFWPG